MNAFEDIVAMYLEAEGYWVRQLVKVDISKEDKKKLGTPTMPTPEIDIVAYDVKTDELLLVEARSYLDSHGVDFESVIGTYERLASKYKLFNDKSYRDIITRQLVECFHKQGLIKKNTKINLALAVGRFYSQDEPRLKDHFRKKGWKLITPKQIKNKVKELADKGWEDNLATITAKLILRED